MFYFVTSSIIGRYFRFRLNLLYDHAGTSFDLCLHQLGMQIQFHGWSHIHHKKLAFAVLLRFLQYHLIERILLQFF